MQTMLYFKALLTVDSVILRLSPEFDYKKETRRAIRLIRMRELDKMYAPGSTIDRALSLQMLLNSLPDFLIARLQDFEQGQKTIYRKLNLIPVVIANFLKFVAWCVFLSGLALLVERSGVLDVIPLMTHPYVVVFFDYVGNLLYVIPVVFLFLIWLSRYLIARSYVKVQKSE